MFSLQKGSSAIQKRQCAKRGWTNQQLSNDERLWGQLWMHFHWLNASGNTLLYMLSLLSHIRAIFFQMCCPTVSHICSIAGGRLHDTQRSTSYDAGVLIKRTYTQAYATSHRYYYDAEQGRCISFTYNGALGNFNNFKSATECEMFCAKLQCNYGTPLKIGPNNQRCSTNTDCPSTHQCQTDHNVCCPRPRK